MIPAYLAPTASEEGQSQTKLYRRKYKSLVAKLSRQLSVKECEDLFFIYKDIASLPATIRPSGLAPQTGISAIRLLERLEQAREFAYDCPQKLRDVLLEIEREDLCKEVETFVANNEEVIQFIRDQLTSHILQTTRTSSGNLYGQVSNSQTDLQTDGPYLPKIRGSKVEVSQPATTSEDLYTRFYSPTSIDLPLVDEKRPRSRSISSLDSLQLRQLPSPPLPRRRLRTGTDPSLPVSNFKRSTVIRRKSRRTVDPEKHDDDSYSYIDPRRLQIERSHSNLVMYRSTNDSPSSVSSCVDSPPSSIGEEAFGTFKNYGRYASSEVSESSDDHIYEYPFLPDILHILPSEPKPLVKEKMRLLVRPIRKMITKGRHSIVNSKPIIAALSKLTFELCITMGTVLSTSQTESDTSTQQLHTSTLETNKFMSADLYLVSDSQCLESLVLQARLEVRLPRRSTKRKNKTDSVTKRTDTGRKQPVQCIHEQSVLLDLPVSCSTASSSTNISKDGCSKQTAAPSVRVACFPNILSHANLMNDKLVTTPYLELKLVVREFNT